jgi:hypothetical protein
MQHQSSIVTPDNLMIFPLREDDRQEKKTGVQMEGRIMSCDMSLHDFDQAVKMILDQEFVGVLEMGLVSEADLFPVMVGMRNSLRQAFTAMSGAQAELHLQQLQQECRDTANSIFALAESAYWN